MQSEKSNSVDPDQTAPLASGSALFGKEQSDQGLNCLHRPIITVCHWITNQATEQTIGPFSGLLN